MNRIHLVWHFENDKKKSFQEVQNKTTFSVQFRSAKISKKYENRSSRVFSMSMCLCFCLLLCRSKINRTNISACIGYWCCCLLNSFYFIPPLKLPVTHDSYYLICTSSLIQFSSASCLNFFSYASFFEVCMLYFFFVFCFLSLFSMTR